MMGGYTFNPPQEDRHFYSKRELTGQLVVGLGGRISEELIFNEITTGARNDLEQVTVDARRMVCEFGMSEKLGNLTFGRKHGPIFLGRDLVEEKDYSEATAMAIDAEVKKIVDESYQLGRKLLSDNIERLKTLANKLLEKEVLGGEEVKKLLGFSSEKSEQDKPA
jgi:cell division protease FtsH